MDTEEEDYSMEPNIKINKSKLSLKQALLILMKEKSFLKITIKELCKLANLNRSTFYVNYGDINELLFDIHTDFFQGISDVLETSRKAPHESSHEECIEKLTEVIKYIEENKETFQLLHSNNEGNLFEKNLLDYYMSLYVKENDSYMERYIFMYHAIGSFSLVSQWLQEDIPYPLEKLAKLICEMSRSAREYYNKEKCTSKK